MEIKHFSDTSFDGEVLSSDKPVLVDFYADWCGPCRMVAPVIEEIANSMSEKVIVGKVDVDANPSIAEKYGVKSIPTVILFNQGQEVARRVGFGEKSDYVEMINKA